MNSEDMKIQVLEFQKEYPTINLYMMKNNPKDYDMSILVVYTLELEHGFIVKKLYKTSRKGTKVTYKPCESEEEFEGYKKKLDELINNYNEKYETNYTL